MCPFLPPRPRNHASPSACLRYAPARRRDIPWQGYPGYRIRFHSRGQLNLLQTPEFDALAALVLAKHGLSVCRENACVFP
jgi:hypothetical protein